MHKVHLVIGTHANWWQTIFVETEPDTPKFRVYVKAADGKWYKQQRPFWFAEHKYYVFCAFGYALPGTSRYSLVALDATEKLPNILLELPQEKIISSIEEVVRV